jgi:hypothetical protein
MDGSRFDAWTRRRFGLAAAGAAAGLLSLLPWDDAFAKRNKRKKRKKRKLRSKQCEPLGTGCNPHNDQRLCCAGLSCIHVDELGGRHCCHGRFGPCNDNADCCSNLQCVGDDEDRFCDIPGAG